MEQIYVVCGTTVSGNFHSISMHSFNRKMHTEKWDCTQHKRSNYIAKLYSLKVISIILHIRGQCEGTAASTFSLF